MNLRHVAARAGVGWYLVIPATWAKESWICADTFSAVFARYYFGWGKDCPWTALIVDDKAPLSKRQQCGEPFERLAYCEQARDKAALDEQEYNKSNDSTINDPKRRPSSQFVLATCVASDYPRLKP